MSTILLGFSQLGGEKKEKEKFLILSLDISGYSITRRGEGR